MVLLLNALGGVLVAAGVILVGTSLFVGLALEDMNRAKRLMFAGAACGLLVVVLSFLTPSYLPKGEVRKLELPPLPVAETGAEIQDNLLKPEMNSEQRKKQFDDKFDAVEQAKE